MPLEQEVIPMMIGGFLVVMGAAVLLTLFLWIKNRNNNSGYIWTLFHFAAVSIAFYLFIEAITFTGEPAMLSEEVSLRIGAAGLFWAGGMVFLIIGLVKFSAARNTSHAGE